ncbi:TraX family protein, partial [Pseudomonas sp. SHC52]|uniref:TraX family protein n=2 Tax=unclassified Pseudomonas TaxID=196821 RepID=UPI001C43A678
MNRRDGALDLLKWLALLAMVLDHLRYVGFSADWLYVPGRLAFPGFCLAMAANLARDGAGVMPWRYLGWLLLFSAVSEIPYRLFIPDPSTLNVLPTLVLGLLVARGWR